MASLSIASQVFSCRFSDPPRPAAMLQLSRRCATGPLHVAPLPSCVSSSPRASSRGSASCFLPLGDPSSEFPNRALSACASAQLRWKVSRTKLGGRDFAKGAQLGSQLTDCRREAGKRLRGGTVVARAVPYEDGSKGSTPVVVSTPEDRYKDNGSSSPKFGDSYDPSDYIKKGSVTSNTAAILRGNKKANLINAIENRIERVIFNCRFLTLLAVFGSLAGSVLCFLKGCLYVSHSYNDYIKACLGGTHTSRVILYLVEAVDVYLMGTVMLIFGMGLYELFVSSLEVPSYGTDGDGSSRSTVCGSNLFGLFRIRQRPAWLEITSLDELKTKLGHVIVMILLVGLFEKSKKVAVHTAMDFLCFSASILLSSAALYLLSILHNQKH